MRIAKHFTAWEFRCRCGKCENAEGYTPPAFLRCVLDYLRDQLNAPVIINSAKRCEAHNKAEGGATNSRHLIGDAADVRVPGVSPARVFHTLEASPFARYLGLSKYQTFVHVDTRGHKARW